MFSPLANSSTVDNALTNHDERPNIKTHLGAIAYKYLVEKHHYTQVDSLHSLPYTNSWKQAIGVHRDRFQPGRTCYQFDVSPYAHYTSFYTPLVHTNGVHSATDAALNPIIFTRSADEYDDIATALAKPCEVSTAILNRLKSSFDHSTRDTERTRGGYAYSHRYNSNPTPADRHDSDDENYEGGTVVNITDETEASTIPGYEMDDNDDLDDKSDSHDGDKFDISIPQQPLVRSGAKDQSKQHLHAKPSASTTQHGATTTSKRSSVDDEFDDLLLSAFGGSHTRPQTHGDSTHDDRASEAVPPAQPARPAVDEYIIAQLLETQIISTRGEVIRDVVEHDDLLDTESSSTTASAVMAATQKRKQPASTSGIGDPSSYDDFDELFPTNDFSLDDVRSLLKNATVDRSSSARETSIREKKQQAKLDKEAAMLSKELNLETESEQRENKRQRILGIRQPPSSSST